MEITKKDYDTSFDTLQSSSIKYKPKMTYLDRLFELRNSKEIDEKIIEDVNKKLHCSNKKSAKNNDEILYILIYVSHVEQQIECDPISLAEHMGINLKNSVISKMRSGTYATEQEILLVTSSIPILVLHPKKYINEIVYELYNQNQIDFNINECIEKIENFTDEICELNEDLIQENPKNMAAAICFYYLTFVLGNKVNKKFFLNLKIKETDFSKCFKKIKNNFK